ncbi:hypothetical protein RF11_04883 [Thelohanellus kitauei]|uniref:Uncharacterized protein n=1 Tax=Thelohanellus kitauei TaxID=669202 RepID=A0A0C2JV49_THEKT|nr:hypothetical protein RF11_04883 [Thelohanellus kitauei]
MGQVFSQYFRYTYEFTRKYKKLVDEEPDLINENPNFKDSHTQEIALFEADEQTQVENKSSTTACDCCPESAECYIKKESERMYHVFLGAIENMVKNMPFINPSTGDTSWNMNMETVKTVINYTGWVTNYDGSALARKRAKHAARLRQDSYLLYNDADAYTLSSYSTILLCFRR